MRQSRYLDDDLYNCRRYTDNFLLTYGFRSTEDGFPILLREEYKPLEWVRFNSARTTIDKAGKGVHFFLDDYAFSGVWNRLESNTQRLYGFDAVMSPDYSLYRDYPVPMQKWNHYKKHAVGAYWQSNGIAVYPSVSWSDEKSYEWCFNGEPECAVVCVSSIGTQKDPESRRLFLKGYDAMLERLDPEVIIFYGKVPDGCRGNIVWIKSHQEHMKEVLGNG